ncbi:hypothetical protein [Kineococcus rhizosphaerae]|uniref:hypothetical protein n=1 Tax=Kineococcus rhizosphaerae TaxID=559628 RepID=UPI0011B27774|nr:hypothetical protein [Kineococcus rhizosphaerae]
MTDDFHIVGSEFVYGVSCQGVTVEGELLLSISGYLDVSGLLVRDGANVSLAPRLGEFGEGEILVTGRKIVVSNQGELIVSIHPSHVAGSMDLADLEVKRGGDVHFRSSRSSSDSGVYAPGIVLLPGARIQHDEDVRIDPALEEAVTFS